jgi:tRNA nucleotidyltransferase (CCA-adding enzyme)
MKIILTHEQADFDALASMLGANLLDEQAVPVLPRRLNRNVRAYLTLYGLDLPFIEPQDLPKGRVKTVTLVDTQSLVTVRGMDKHTEVFVIDHHEARADLPADWQVKVSEIGAASTLLVEALEEHGIPLNVTQATLLLLGIYEDTGKLTYSRTSPRDVRAAAYLLEQGASLQIMQDFINHPLSKVQQEIYDQLREASETHAIAGNTVIIGRADASHTDEELSTIAHKLRDLLDPDAIFLLIQTPSGIQLIARATTDQVNVGEVAKHFGGGGHPRAAAALIRDRDGLEVHQELVQILPKFVHPAVTVAEIMSSRPQVLDPATPVRQAADRMQRYGYEGYPVVENGRLVGLVTRRAVDRTIGHKLNLTVGQVMEAGEVTVGPETPLETLQQIMTDSGWGQVPVVAEGEIVGIVTRTDLLKTLSSNQPISGRKNLASRLEAGLPPARLALLMAVAAAAQQQQAAVYIVGGFVRDLLLERPSLDYDLVVEGDAIALGRRLVQDYGGRTTTHRRFGTAKWKIASIREHLAARLAADGQRLDPADLPEALDLISARREFYTYPTALPTVERGSIKLDLHRRDFTINTLAIRLDGKYYGDLHDHWGGLADLQAGLVRVLHSLSFVDDPTRILRAVRFEQRFGYQIEHRTLELLENALGLLDRVSGDRVRHELEYVLGEPAWLAMVARLSELGVLQALHPALVWDQNVRARVEQAQAMTVPENWHQPAGEARLPEPLQPAVIYLSWLLDKPWDEATQAAQRLRLPGWTIDDLQAAIKLWGRRVELVDGAPSEIVAFCDQVSPLALLVCYHLADEPGVRSSIESYFSRWRQVQPHTSGHDLRALGLPPGPVYKQILDSLRAAWLDGEVSSAEQEKDLLAQLVERLTADG